MRPQKIKCDRQNMLRLKSIEAERRIFLIGNLKLLCIPVYAVKDIKTIYNLFLYMPAIAHGLCRSFSVKAPFKILILTILFLSFSFAVSAGETQDSVRIYFHQGKINIDTCLHENGQRLKRLPWRILAERSDSSLFISKVLVVGGASPEGSIKLNRWLSEQRAERLFDYVCRYYPMADTLKTSVFLGRDWNGLYRLVQNDANVPYREETLEILNGIVSAVAGGEDGEREMHRLRQLRGGVPYNYMYRNLFPELRSSVLYVWYDRHRKPLASDTLQACRPGIPVGHVCDTLRLKELDFSEQRRERSYLPVGIKSNMLYDALLVPNIGVEFYCGQHWSVGCNWMYAWWKSDRRHHYWRTYGGDVEVRYWLGERAGKSPLEGHHIGLYGQILTYDFELGGKGFLADKWTYGAGVSYGYSLPVARHLNIDFTAGIGYLSGQYKKYLPIDNHYVWQSTHNRNCVFPTKVEVSLVWLPDIRNPFRKKGGRR